MQPPAGNQRPPWPGRGQTGSQQQINGHTGPFDDTGYAPELRAERSENLYRREAEFWQRMPEPEQTQSGMPPRSAAGEHPQQFRPTRSIRPPKGRPGSHTAAWIIGIVCVLCMAAGLFWSYVPLVRHIEVEGNSRYTDQQIIDASGLKLGMNRFFVKPDEVDARLEKDRYLVCELVYQPDLWTVVIRVKERQISAAITHNGLLLYADHRGVVLEEGLDNGALPKGMVRVKGLSVRRGDLGRTITLADINQLYVYNEIFVELKVMDALPWIVELDMSDMDSIFLETEDGYSVCIGDSTDIHAKLRSMILTVDYLRRGDYGPGTVNVSSPVYPSYIPDPAWSVKAPEEGNVQ